MADNFLKQLLQNMQSQQDRIEEKVDENTILTQQVGEKVRQNSGRLSKLEAAVFGKVEKKDLPSSPFQNPKVINTLFFVALTILLVVAAIFGVDIKALL